MGDREMSLLPGFLIFSWTRASVLTYLTLLREVKTSSALTTLILCSLIVMWAQEFMV